MQSLQAEFLQSVLAPSYYQGRVTETDTESAAEGADGMDSLTYDYEYNPFAEFMKELQVLINTDPEEAFRLLRTTMTDKLFTKDSELSRMSLAMDEIIEQLQLQSYENEQHLQGPVVLRGAFTEPACGLDRATYAAMDEPEVGGSAPEIDNPFAKRRMKFGWT